MEYNRFWGKKHNGICTSTAFDPSYFLTVTIFLLNHYLPSKGKYKMTEAYYFVSLIETCTFWVYQEKDWGSSYAKYVYTTQIQKIINQKNSILCESIELQIQILCASINKWNCKIHIKVLDFICSIRRALEDYI